MPTTKRKLQIKTTKKIEKEYLKFVPLGGMEEIGRNCSYFEYKDEIVVVDAGIQFPEEETPGIDYIIPNVSSLEPKKDKVCALIITHGHYDHIHALPYIIEKIGNPIIYTSTMTRELIVKRAQEFPNLPKLKIQTVNDGDVVTISSYLTAEFFAIDHTIPDSVGFILKTPVGNMLHFGDFRVEYDINEKPMNLDVFEKIAQKGIHTAFIDSTNSDIEGHSLSEKLIQKNLEDLFKAAKGRVVVATFASLITRLAEIIQIAERLGRKVAINGRSMRDNIQIAQRLGYVKTKKGTIIQVEEVNKYKDEQIMILSTGGQGEPRAGLTKIANGEHKILRFKPTDTVIFSSSVVPGNERSVQALQDNISRQVDEVYNSKLLDIHSGGHARHDDIELVLKIIKPRFVVPAYAYYFKRKATQKIAESVGIPKANSILMDNGQVAHITKDSFKVSAETVPAFYVMVDGLGVGDVEQVVLRDRLALSAEGMVVIIATLDREHGRLVKNPDIISRGFIYMKENQEILIEMRKRIKSIFDRIPHHQPLDPDYIKSLLRDQIGLFLYNKTHRRPMVLPVIIDI